MVSRVNIDLAHPRDVPDILKLVRLAYAQYDGQFKVPPAPLTYDYEEGITAGKVIAVKNEGSEIVGTVTIERRSNYIELRNLAVLPGARGSGIGTSLVEKVEEYARDIGIPMIRLWTRAEMRKNIRFYLHLGYVIKGEKAENGTNRTLFEKAIQR